jgi:hypothetical protein
VRIRRTIIVAAALLLSFTATASAIAVSSTTTPSAVHHAKAFVMPSRNIACLYDAGNLRCDIYSGIKPEPRKACKFFWKGVMLRPLGQATFLCIIDTISQPDAPALKYGSIWHRGSITCRSSTRGLRCHNDIKHGFFLSRESSRKW